MAIRELLLSLGVEVDKNGLNSADQALGSIKKAAIAAAAAFVAIKAVQGIGALVTDVTAMGDELDKTSAQLGISTDALQEWRFAAGLAGASGTEMSAALAKLQKNAVDAAEGGTAMAEGFEKLGVDVLDSTGEVKDANLLLTEMSDGFKELENDAQRSAIAQELLGKAGKKLIPLLVGGSEAIGDMRKEAQELGGVMSKELIASTVELTDDQFRAQQAWQGVKNDIAQAIIPIYLKLAHAMQAVAQVVRAVLKPAFQIFGNIIGVFTDGAEELNKIFDGLGTTMLAMVPILAALGIAIKLFGTRAVFAGIKTAISWALALLPFLLMIAAIALLLLAIDDVITFFKGGDSLIGELIKSFKKWLKEMGGISGAVGKIFENLMKDIFGVSDDTARTIGAVFAAMAAVLEFIWGDIIKPVALVLGDIIVFVIDFAKDFVKFIVEAIDFVVAKFEALTDAVADAIGEVSEFLGLDEDVAVGTSLTQETADERRREGIAKQIAVFKKLEAEGLGTAVIKRDSEGKFVSAGLTNAKEGAGQRALELRQDINAPITVTVDATGRDDANEVGAVVGNAVKRNQPDYRQAAQGFQTKG